MQFCIGECQQVAYFLVNSHVIAVMYKVPMMLVIFSTLYHNIWFSWQCESRKGSIFGDQALYKTSGLETCR